VIRVTIKP